MTRVASGVTREQTDEDCQLVEVRYGALPFDVPASLWPQLQYQLTSSALEPAIIYVF